MMKKLFNNVPAPGLTYFDRHSANPDDGFLVRPNHVLVEFHREKFYLDFYIVPSKEGRCILLGYVPELALVEKLKNDKLRLLKMMQQSGLFAKVLKDSLAHKSRNSFNFAAINDFTEDGETSRCWCVKYVSDVAYNQNIFDDTFPESQIIVQTLADISAVADDFLGVYNAYCLDPTNKEWLRSPLLAAVADYACKIDEEKLCPFGNRLDNDDLPENVKELLLKEGYILITQTGQAYPFDVEVSAKDIGDSTLAVRADLFFPKMKKDKFAYYIYLKLKDGKWEASLEMQCLAEWVDTILNHVDTKNKKIPALAYKYLPFASHIWVNSIAVPRHKNFKDYVDVVLKADQEIADRPFSDNGYKNFVKRGSRIVCQTLLDIDFTTRPWNIQPEIAELVFYGIVITYEVFTIVKNTDAIEKELKQRKKQQWLELGGNLLKIASKVSRFS